MTRKILVLGGGTMGLATAIELAQGGAQVTVLNHHPQAAALYAAAGMLAPQAEEIEDPVFKAFCLESRDRYPQWVAMLESLSGTHSGYWPCGIVAPKYHNLDQPTLYADQSVTLDAEQQWWSVSDLKAKIPEIGDGVAGAWFYPKDAQVNNRQLGHALSLAAETVGVKVHNDVTINAVACQGDRIEKIKTQQGDWEADHYLLTTGAWTGMLEDFPVIPRKGQMMSLTPMDGAQQVDLRQVLFGEDIYIVPRQTGEIVLGATSEEVGFTPGNTVEGVQSLLNAATRLVPGLKHYEIYQQWWGYRPTTPDELPILGPSPWENLSIASGHYRNGILLAPITAHLISQFILKGELSSLLLPYVWTRFQQTQPLQPTNAMLC